MFARRPRVAWPLASKAIHLARLHLSFRTGRYVIIPAAWVRRVCVPPLNAGWGKSTGVAGGGQSHIKSNGPNETIKSTPSGDGGRKGAELPMMSPSSPHRNYYYYYYFYDEPEKRHEYVCAEKSRVHIKFTEKYPSQSGKKVLRAHMCSMCDVCRWNGRTCGLHA